MTVLIDRWDRNFLKVTFPVNDFIIAAIRDVPGREWVHPKKFWKIPIGSSPLLLAQLDNNKIPYSLTDIGKQYLITYRDMRQRLIDIKMRTVDDEVQIDGMEYPLRPYQSQGVDFITAGKRTLLADDMGLGKTVMGIASIILLQPRTTLIPVMNSLKYNWLNEIKKHAPGLHPIVVEGGKSTRKAIWESDYPIKICNYQLLEHDKDIMPINWDMIFADEATSFKSSATKTSQRIKNLSSTYAVAASGTPLENHLMEMHSIMEFVRSGILGSRWDFKNRHIEMGFNGTVTGYKNVQEFHEKITPWMLRRRKRDVLKDLPDKQQIRVDIELNNDEARLYSKWRASVVHFLDSIGNVTSFNSQNILTQMLRLKQIVDHPLLLEDEYNGVASKFEAVKDIVEDTDQKIVIFTQFTGMAHILKREFNAECIEGAVSAQERMNIIDRFQTDDKQVLVSTDAGAFGLNITAASIVIHYDLTWNPAKQAQREDRLHRIGQKNAVTVYTLVAKNTIDEYILDTLFRKLQAFDLLVEQADDLIIQRIRRMDIEQMLSMSP